MQQQSASATAKRIEDLGLKIDDFSAEVERLAARQAAVARWRGTLQRGDEKTQHALSVQ